MVCQLIAEGNRRSESSVESRACESSVETPETGAGQLQAGQRDKSTVVCSGNSFHAEAGNCDVTQIRYMPPCLWGTAISQLLHTTLCCGTSISHNCKIGDIHQIGQF